MRHQAPIGLGLRIGILALLAVYFWFILNCFLLGIGSLIVHEVVGQKYGVNFGDLGAGLFGLTLAGVTSGALLAASLDYLVPHWRHESFQRYRATHPVRFWISIVFWASLTVSFVVMGASFIWSAFVEVVG